MSAPAGSALDSHLPQHGNAGRTRSKKPPQKRGAAVKDRYDRLIGYLFLAPSVVLVFLLVFVPFVAVLVLSLQRVQTGDLTGPFVALDNFKWAITSSYFQHAFVTSLIYVFGGVALELVIGVPAALLLNKDFKLRAWARALVIFPYLLPTIVAVIVFRFMFDDLMGIVNYLLVKVGVLSQPISWLGDPTRAMVTAIMVSGWKFFPFVVIALLAVLQSIPADIYEAAAVDGAGPLQRFRRITLPHLMPVILLTALLRTIWNFDKFDIIFMMTGGGPADATTTVPVAIYRTAFDDFELGRAGAIGVLLFIALLLLLALYSFLMRRAESKF